MYLFFKNYHHLIKYNLERLFGIFLILIGVCICLYWVKLKPYWKKKNYISPKTQKPRRNTIKLMRSEVLNSQHSKQFLHQQTTFDPAALSKEEEKLFYGQRSWESFVPNDHPFAVMKKSSNKLADYIPNSRVSLGQKRKCPFQCFYIPPSNRIKSYFDVLMMFLVVYSVFTSVY